MAWAAYGLVQDFIFRDVVVEGSVMGFLGLAAACGWAALHIESKLATMTSCTYAMLLANWKFQCVIRRNGIVARNSAPPKTIRIEIMESFNICNKKSECTQSESKCEFEEVNSRTVKDTCI